MSILTDKTPIDEIFPGGDEMERAMPSIISLLEEEIDRAKTNHALGISDDVRRVRGLIFKELVHKCREIQGGNKIAADTPITPEFLEGLGFYESSYYIGTYIKKDLRVDTASELRVYIVNEVATKIRSFPHIRTQSQLVGLIAALFGGGE